MIHNIIISLVFCIVGVALGYGIFYLFALSKYKKELKNIGVKLDEEKQKNQDLQNKFNEAIKKSEELSGKLREKIKEI